MQNSIASKLTNCLILANGGSGFFYFISYIPIRVVCRVIRHLIQLVGKKLPIFICLVSVYSIGNANIIYPINIPDQPLAQSLNLLSSQTEISVLFPYALVENLQGQAVNGNFTVHEAMKILLKGTGLIGSLTEQDVITIRRHQLRPSEQRAIGNITMKHKKSAISTILALLFSGSTVTNVSAKENSEIESTLVEVISVTGARLQNQRSIDVKRNKQQISDVVISDDIGKQPDFNIGDALKRISGVSTIPEEDEAQFVSVRGINPDLTWVTLDGAAVASASPGEGRRVSLEFFPASMVQGLEVIKSRTADMDGNIIGGQINLKTRSALSNPGLQVLVTGMAGRFSGDNAPVGLDDSSGDNSLSWRLDGTISNTFGNDNQFGFVVSASYFAKDRDEERFLPLSVIDTDGFENPDSNYAPNLNIWSTYNNPIDRHGIFGKFEYKVNDEINMSLQGQRFYQDDYARRDSELIVAGTPTFIDENSGTVTGAFFSYGVDQFEAENTYTGLQYLLEYQNDDAWEAALRISLSDGKFYQDDPDIDFNSVTVDYSYVYDTNGLARITFDNPELALDPRNHRLRRIRPFFQDYNNTADEIEGSIGHSYNLDGWGYKAGFKSRRSNQNFTTAQDVNNYIGNTATLADFEIETNYDQLFRPGGGSIFGSISEIMEFLSNTPQDFATTIATPSELYSVDENVTGYFLSMSYVADDYQVIFGGRYEDTEVSSTSGNITQKSDYGNFLPSALFVYDLSPEMVLRASYSKALGRADIGDLRISTAEDLGASTLSVSGGNPSLKPRLSDNFDLSWEYYYDDSNMLSIALFHKSIEDEIFTLSTVGSFEGQDAIFSLPQNASNASLTGLELGLVVSKLPGMFTDFGLSANYTYIDAQTTLLDSDGTKTNVDWIFEQPKNIYNISVFYQKDAFEAQIAYNYSDSFHSSFSGDVGFTDEFDEYKTLDFQARYYFTENVILIGEVRNILEQPLERRTGPNLRLLNDISEFGRSYFVGATYKF